MGIYISYDRVMEIEDWIATSTCERFKEDGVVSPACLRKGLFTVGALDILDHNPSSTTSQSSFHGTEISLYQFPTTIPPPSGAKEHSLPHSYAFVPAVALTTTTHVSVPKLESIEPTTTGLDEAIRAKCQPGRPGWHMKRLQRHWSTRLVTRLKSWMYILITFGKLRD